MNKMYQDTMAIEKMKKESKTGKKVYTNEEYLLLEENEKWSKIKLNTELNGWVYNDYIKKLHN
jgi:hypothetical protein